MPKTKKRLSIKLTDTLLAQQNGSGWSLKGHKGGSLYFPSLHALLTHLVVVDPSLVLGSKDSPLTPSEFVALMDELIASLRVTIPSCGCQP